jgi:hypothetical protein
VKARTIGNAMAKTFQSPATLTGISSKVDGGLSIRFVTKELTPEEKLIALEFQNTYGHVLFRENEFKPEDVPQADAEDDDVKSLSTRLRNVFFVYWKQRDEQLQRQGKDHLRVYFEDFRRKEMEKIIEAVKKRLDSK